MTEVRSYDVGQHQCPHCGAVHDRAGDAFDLGRPRRDSLMVCIDCAGVFRIDAHCATTKVDLGTLKATNATKRALRRAIRAVEAMKRSTH